MCCGTDKEKKWAKKLQSTGCLLHLKRGDIGQGFTEEQTAPLGILLW